MTRKPSMPVQKADFGAWLKERLAARGLALTAVTSAAGLTYPNFNALVNSGKRGKPVQPEEGTMEKVIPTLLSLGLIEDEAEAWIAAGYVPDGHTIVRERPGIEYAPDPESQRMAEVYGGATEEGRKLMEAAAEAVEKAFSRDSIGKRTDD